jgi:hypothetical protein
MARLGVASPSAMIVFQPNRKILTEDKQKIQESILYLLSIRKRLTQFQIGKALYFADLYHLNKHGRPVTFDNYSAMRKGPVPSLAYNALKPEYNYRESFGLERPWTWTPRDKNPEANEFMPLRGPDLDALSETDLEALRRGLKIVLDTPPEVFERLTHDNTAYRDAWLKRGTKGSYPMRLALMIEENGEELAADLAYISAH